MSSGKTNIFPAAYRLLSRAEFNLVWNKGRKYHADHFIVVVLNKNTGLTRLGITASKKVGGAIQRNRVKRLLREFFRNHYSQLPQHADISIIAKKKSASVSYDVVYAELSKLLTG